MFFSKKETKETPATEEKSGVQGPPSAAQIKEKLTQGAMKVVIVFEIAGKPEKHVVETLHAFMTNIKSDSRITVLKEDIAEPIEHDDGMFSTFNEMEALVQDAETLTWLAINFTPASIEVLAPEELHIKQRELTNWYNDLLAKLHETSTTFRNERSINVHMTESLNALIQNGIILSLKNGSKTAKQVQQDLGIHEKQLEPFFQHFLKKGKIVLSGKTYSLR